LSIFVERRKVELLLEYQGKGKSMKTTSHSCALSAFLLLLAFGAPARAATLSAIFIHSCDDQGNPAGNFVWDTRGSSSDFYKIFVTRGTPGGPTDGLVAPFANGPTWALAPINVPLEEGTNEFTVFFQYNGPWRAFAINLFFESNRVADICAKAPLRTNDVVPPFSANSTRSTYSMTSYPSPNAAASGTTSVTLDRLIELTDYSVAATNVFAQNRVWTHGVGSDSRFDFVGTFTLRAGRERRPPPDNPVRIDLHITEVTICWLSESNREYQVQYRSPRTSDGWMNLGPVVPGTGGTNCVADRVPIGEGQRVYRVIDVP
jgi:hypothetical protein